MLTYRHVYISLSSPSRVEVGVEVEGLLLEVDSIRRGIKSVVQSQSRRAKNKSESQAKGLRPLPG